MSYLKEVKDQVQELVDETQLQFSKKLWEILEARLKESFKAGLNAKNNRQPRHKEEKQEPSSSFRG